jgi:2-polyprenyl-3-methyl-5-hydroxy-6-metoxy-1,4-benzoquinol methylase
MSILLDNIKCKHLLNSIELNDYKLKSIDASVPHHVFHVKDSIHYNAIKTNDFTLYAHLIKSTNQLEHSVEIYKKLLETFSLTEMPLINITLDPLLKTYIVTDGIHRLSIMLLKGIITDTVPLKYLNITIDNDTINDFKKHLTKTTEKNHYNGWNNRTNFGYHSFNLYNFNVSGQRNPRKRTDIMKNFIDFTDKSVLDLGCNSGGILLHLPEIKSGTGIDYDTNCIESAIFMNEKLMINNKLTFSVMDLNNLVITSKFDIIFLLSLGSWVKDWKKMYINCINNSKTIILETNNDNEGKPQLDLFRSHNCTIKLISSESRDDITGNYGRKTYLITN